VPLCDARVGVLTGYGAYASSTRVSKLRGILTSSQQAGTVGRSPLAPAELRLLPYLETHLTIREIGNRLFVSRNTVSSKVGSFYRELGASSRHDAVQPAAAVGLLGG
jgi:LuxR family transcriptional regulator, maltose regulon positive regulatory protein